jgi:DHA1 family bicyclomycin/chloramphenicol resistance-like MFS transporter
MRIPPKSAAFTLVLGLLAALPALSIDVSAPTLVVLPAALGTSGTAAGVTLSLFMAGFAAGQLIGGYVSDRTGRRPVLIASLLCFTLAAAGCTASQSAAELLAFRLVQGIGAGSCSVLAFAMIQDLFTGDQARSKRSYVAVVFGTMPILAPALGVWLLDVGGWRATHGTLALAGAALWIVSLAGVAESRPAGLGAARPSAAERPGLWRWLRSEQPFLRLAAVNAVSYGGLFAYIAGSPVVVITEMKLPAGVYAALFAATASALGLGAWVSGWLARRHVATVRVLDAGFAISAVGCLGGLVLLADPLSRPALHLPGLLALFFCRGILAPNLQHLAIGGRREDAGVASATLGVLQLLSGALTSAAVAALNPEWKIRGVIAVAAGFGIAAAMAWFGIIHRRRL